MAKSKKSETTEKELTEVAVEETAEKVVEIKPERKNVHSRVWVYIGPTIFGCVQNGTIYEGTRESVLERLSMQIEKHPHIKDLVVADCELAEKQKAVSTHGNWLNKLYESLAKSK